MFATRAHGERSDHGLARRSAGARGRVQRLVRPRAPGAGRRAARLRGRAPLPLRRCAAQVSRLVRHASTKRSSRGRISSASSPSRRPGRGACAGSTATSASASISGSCATSAACPTQDTPWLYLVHTDIPDHIVGRIQRVVRQGAPAAPRDRAGRGARAALHRGVGQPALPHGLRADRPDAFESPEGLKARKTPWTEKMRSLFQNTRRSMCRLILPSDSPSRMRDE